MTADAARFMAEASGNVALDGNFSIQVRPRREARPGGIHFGGIGPREGRCATVAGGSRGAHACTYRAHLHLDERPHLAHPDSRTCRLPRKCRENRPRAQIQPRAEAVNRCALAITTAPTPCDGGGGDVYSGMPACSQVSLHHRPAPQSPQYSPYNHPPPASTPHTHPPRLTADAIGGGSHPSLPIYTSRGWHNTNSARTHAAREETEPPPALSPLRYCPRRCTELTI
eukprot:scaffold19885_cov141-Isochrysis_galbana.AAC.2